MFLTFIVVTLCLCSQALWYPTNFNNFITYKIHEEVLKSSSNYIRISTAPYPEIENQVSQKLTQKPNLERPSTARPIE